MSIKSIVFPLTGQADAQPNLLYIDTDNTLAQVTTANYLDQAKPIYGNIFNNKQMAVVYTSDSKSVMLQVSISTDGKHASLASPPAASESFTSISVGDGSAAAPSYSFTTHPATGMYYSNTNTVGFAANGLLSFQIASTVGTVNSVIASGGATNAANAALQPGFTAFGSDTNIDVSAVGKGTGGFAVLPSTSAAAGNLKLWNGAGNFYGQLACAALGQTTAYTIPDVGAATGGIVVSTSPVRTKYVAAAAAAGGAAAQSFTDAFCTSVSVVVGNWVTQANAASVLKIVPGNGSFVVTSDADAGVGTFSYSITKA